MTVGSIVRRHGETRQYRVIGFKERVNVGTKATSLLAVLEPVHESMIKRVEVLLGDLIEVKYTMGIE
jgi:hypothetical protein